MNIFEKYRESCYLYLKIDVGIFIFVSTIITLLKLERNEAIDAIFSTKFILYFIIFIFIYSLALERLFLIASGQAPKKAPSIVFSNILLVIQLFLHIFLFGTIVGNSSAWMEYWMKVKQFNHQKQIFSAAYKAVSYTTDIFGKLPATINDLKKNNPQYNEILENYGDSSFLYRYISPKQCVIVLPGSDGKYNTNDDINKYIDFIKEKK